ncbi:MAG: type II toxin-antitoxin system HicB family antitoxin [Desulfarculus sp.]|nr:MAG: type II toxin-antitoxin system HicB family antitoxin [Desulfarculus sp.]
MRLAYPVDLTPDGQGGVIARAPDVPSALTLGRDEAAALHWMQDALLVALSGLMDHGLEVPRPSACKPGQRLVELPQRLCLKLGLYQAMRARGLSHSELAACLACDAEQVRCLLDLDHETELEQVQAALAAVEDSAR